ncbi:Flavonoid 3',5'-hydroxylase [Platanthera zijinensis]|uniref:Flavonoid 3',5'-hydroxylase n=1 Tax=Platanthera zijinensis TaxID=2320716 RepID=A0AAP0BP16_9ASPA
MEYPTLLNFPLLPCAAAAAVIAIIAIYCAALRRSRRSDLPGPIGLPIVGNLPFLHPELHSYFARLAAAHGPIFRLRLGSKLAVVVSSPALAREILRDNDAVFANRDVPAAARVIAYGGADIVWSGNGPTWRMLRRVCVSQLLSPSSLDSYYHLRRRELRSAIRHLYDAAVAGESVGVGTEMFVAVMNTVTGMLWGGTVGEEERSGLGKEFRELVGQITALLGRPNVSDFFPALRRLDLQRVDGKMRVMLEKFDGIFARIIEKKRRLEKNDEGNLKEEDFLGYMLRMEEEGDQKKEPFTMTHVKALLMDMVVGGTDTSSNTVEFALAEMMNRPEIIKRAQEELDQVVGKDNVVEESHLSKLHYLNMVIKEVLRLHPSLPLLVPHCPSSSCAIGGYTVPQGSRVFINIWAIHRDPTLWEDPLEFRPERFDEAEGKWDYAGNDFSYLPFGSGRRKCAGITMGERMVAYSLASLLHSFDWKLPAGTKHDLTEKFGIVLKKAKPLVAIPVPRLSQEFYS